MHAASVIMLSWAMIGAACLFSHQLAGAAAGMLALLVAVVGLPHGAADHRFARPRLEPLVGSAWLPMFLVAYVVVAGVVVCGWIVAPAVTILAFFLASAWHFGAEEPRFAVGPRWLRPAFQFARGGLVIWVPLVAHGAEVGEILGRVTSRGSTLPVGQATAVLTACSWIMLAIAACGWVVQGLAASTRCGWRRRVLLADNLLVASLVALFALASPLVGFLVYFCAWHSARGLRRLRIELGETWAQLAWSLAPLTAAAVALIGLIAWAGFAAGSWNDTLVRATFVGLSAVAIPHLLLHGLAPLLERSCRRRPLEVGSAA